MSVQTTGGKHLPDLGISKQAIHRAARIAFAVQTATDPNAALRAVEQIPLRHRDHMLVALAALADIESPARTNTPRLRKPPRPLPNTAALEGARLAAALPLWDAYRHGDRDPDVTAGHNTYAWHLENLAGVLGWAA